MTNQPTYIAFGSLEVLDGKHKIRDLQKVKGEVLHKINFELFGLDRKKN